MSKFGSEGERMLKWRCRYDNGVIWIMDQWLMFWWLSNCCSLNSFKKIHVLRTWSMKHNNWIMWFIMLHSLCVVGNLFFNLRAEAVQEIHGPPYVLLFEETNEITRGILVPLKMSRTRLEFNTRAVAWYQPSKGAWALPFPGWENFRASWGRNGKKRQE